MHMPRWRSIGARGLLLLGGLLAGGILAECILRVIGVAYPLPYTPDVYAGSRLRPGFQGWYTAEGHAHFEVNRFGFRDHQHRPGKSSGTIRVAVLGDSFAEALQVPIHETFWSVLQRELVQATGGSAGDIEVLNFGVSGYGTAQQLQILRHYVWQFEPDVVLLAFFAGNDLRNNSQQLEPEQVRPFYFLNQANELVLDESFRTHPDFLKARSRSVQLKVALINSSRLLQLVNELRTRARQSAAPGTAGLAAGLDAECFRKPVDPRWDQAWEITERLLAEMHAEVQEKGAEFFVATIPTDVAAHPDPAVRQALADQFDVPDLDYAERRIRDLGSNQGFPVIALTEPMRQYAQQQQVLLYGFPNTQPGAGHWNAAGHRLAGQLIARRILASLPQTE